MENFRTKYNYLIFGLRVVFFLFFAGLLFVFLFYAAPRMLQDKSFDFKTFIGLLAGLFLFLFLPYRFGKLLVTQRDVLSFENEEFQLIDAITGKKHSISVHELKGFSMTKYPTKVWDFKEIILYFNNGRKIELPQFLYLNFREIKPAFESNGLRFLGIEPFRWKFLDSRHYHFD